MPRGAQNRIQSWRRRRWMNRKPDSQWRSKLDFDVLTEDGIALVGQCLEATVSGPFFPDWEFEMLLQLDRASVSSISRAWPKIRNRRTAEMAVNGAFNNLLGYPHGREDVWSDWITGTPDDLLRVWGQMLGEDMSHYYD